MATWPDSGTRRVGRGLTRAYVGSPVSWVTLTREGTWADHGPGLASPPSHLVIAVSGPVDGRSAKVRRRGMRDGEALRSQARVVILATNRLACLRLVNVSSWACVPCTPVSAAT